MTQNLKNNPSSSLLKDTRLSKGLTLEIVHEATKIPMDALRAIEEGYSTRILTPFYYRGFIKIYAEFLGLNVADVLREYNAEPAEIKLPVKPAAAAKPASSFKPAAKKTAAPVTKEPQAPNLLLEQLGEFSRSVFTPKNQKNLLRIAGALIALFLVVKLVGCVAGAIKSRPKSAAKVAAVSKEVKKQRPVKKEEPKEEEAPKEEVQESKKIAASSENRKVTLTAHASKDTSIQVKADGKIIFQMTMKKGTVENWEADNQIELSGRNLGELELEINGKDIGSLASSNRRAKRVVITKDGLSVKK